MADTPAPPHMFDADLTPRGGMAEIRERVGLAVGAASACWENLAGAGVFQSERAAAIAEDLVANVVRLTDFPYGDETAEEREDGTDPADDTVMVSSLKVTGPNVGVVTTGMDDMILATTFNVRTKCEAPAPLVVNGGPFVGCGLDAGHGPEVDHEITVKWRG